MINKRFPKYPDDADYNTNASSYYDDLARKQKLIQLLAEKIWKYENTLNESLEQIEQRLTDYIIQNDSLMNERLENWDQRIDEMPEEMRSLFVTWLNDGTLEQIINHDVLGNKADISDLLKQSKRMYTKTSGHWQARPFAVFTDDDMYTDSLNRLKALTLSKGIPFTVAVINKQGVITDEVKKQELLEMQNDHGWEIASHTMNHEDLSTLNEKEIRTNLENSIRDFKENGFNVESILYPYGGNNTLSRSVVAEYFRSGAITSGTPEDYENNGLNDINKLDPYFIKRINIGEYDMDFQYFKDVIDYATENKQLLVFYTHIYSDWNEEKQTLLENVIDYTKSKMEVGTLSEALNYFEPIIQASDMFPGGSHFRVAKNGHVNSNHAIDMTTSDKFSASDTIDKYTNPITIFAVNTVNAVELGWGEAGTVITVKGSRNPAWDYQMFLAYGRNEIKIRRVPNSVNLEWTEWSTLLSKDTLRTRYTTTISTWEIPSNSTRYRNIVGVPNVVGKTVIASTTDILPDDIIYDTGVNETGGFRLRFFNVSDGPITIPDIKWDIDILNT